MYPWKRIRFAAFLLVVTAGQPVLAEDAGFPTFDDPAKAGPDFKTQGEFRGDLITADEGPIQLGAQVIALGDGKFHLVAYKDGLPGDGWDRLTRVECDGELKDGKIDFRSADYTGTLQGDALVIRDRSGAEAGRLARVERTSPTLGQPAPEGAIVLFDGKSMDGFTGAKLTEDGLLAVYGPHPQSKSKLQDFTLHIEFRTPYMPTARGQARGNCGVFLQSRYEVQVLDSFGTPGRNDDCGAIYSLSAPRVNACLPPLAWQTYDVDFTAARFNEAGEKIKNAEVTVRHNGIVIHDKKELASPTPGGIQETKDPAPILLHYHGNPVRFRNIWAVEKKAEG